MVKRKKRQKKFFPFFFGFPLDMMEIPVMLLIKADDQVTDPVRKN